jgi:FkbM family methyltransferase
LKGWVRLASNWIRLRPRLAAAVLRIVPDYSTTIRLPHLGRFRIRLRRNRAFWLRDPEEFERYPFRVLQHLVRPGDVVADIGANLGLYSRFVASWTRAARVLAFEPWLENSVFLQSNVNLGGAEAKVDILTCALADVEGQAEFQIDDVQSASGSLDKVRGGAASEGRANLHLPPRKAQVDCRTLDGLIEAGRIPAPDVLKIDVEGAEALVLRGAARLLAERRPRLLMELHGAQESRDVLELLFKNEYEVVAWGAGDWRDLRLTRITSTDIYRIKERYDINFLAASADGGLPSEEDLLLSPFESAAHQVPA